MGQFDVHRRPGTQDLLVDCQSDLLADLPTRFVVPLLRTAPKVSLSPHLNPVISFEGADHVLAPQLALSTTTDRLGQSVGSVKADAYAIGRAIDVLVGGV